MNKLLCILLLPLLAFGTVHKFYISVTQVRYSEKDEALQITSRVFIDDINMVLSQRYDTSTALGSTEESETDVAVLEKYLRSKFIVRVNGETVAYTFLGKKYDADMLILYIEAPKVTLENTTSISVENEILTDLYDEQQNVLHYNIKGIKKSFVLLKSDAKGMLNL